MLFKEIISVFSENHNETDLLLKGLMILHCQSNNTICDQGQIHFN